MKQVLALDPRLAAAQVTVLCPKCRQQSAFPESKRGLTAKCGKCGTLFRIPLCQSAAAAGSE